MWSQLRCRLRWHKWQQVYDKNGLESHRACRNCGREQIPIPSTNTGDSRRNFLSQQND